MWQVLLVDTDPEYHERLIGACTGLARVVCVPCAPDARRVLATHVIHLVVAEHRLQHGSGLDLLATVRARWPRLPVVISTAFGSEAICVAAFRLGARDYFIKPWEPAEMARAIRTILTVGRRDGERRHDAPAPELTIRRAARHIEEHHADVVPFGQLAHDLGLSKSTLSRKFKQVAKMPYRRFLVACRIARARELLGGRDHSITEIAQIVGFGDLPRFDKVFKAVVGVSPSSYRQQRTTERNKLLDGGSGS
jgi:AraC-like DNA-binding protein/CheY-like chemotaxis protein